MSGASEGLFCQFYGMAWRCLVWHCPLSPFVCLQCVAEHTSSGMLDVFEGRQRADVDASMKVPRPASTRFAPHVSLDRRDHAPAAPHLQMMLMLRFHVAGCTSHRGTCSRRLPSLLSRRHLSTRYE